MTWRTGRKGFSVDFPNGWTASVVWAGGTYSSNYNQSPSDETLQPAKLVEVGAWRTGNQNIWIDRDMVRGYLNHQEVLDYMQSVSNLPNNDESGYNTKKIPSEIISSKGE